MPPFRVLEAGASPPPTDLDLTLFVHTLCPYAERVFLAMLEAEKPFQLVHIDLSKKPAWYRSINPASLVPAVLHKGTVITESLDILEWLAADQSYFTKDVCSLLRVCNSFVSAGLNYVAGTGRVWGISSGQTASQRASYEGQMRLLGDVLRGHGGTFLVANTSAPTVVDCAFYPFAHRFDLISRHILSDEELTEDIQFLTWLRDMRSRDACKTTSADTPLLLQAFQNERSLDFFDYSTYGIFDLHPHNVQYLS